MSLLNLGRILSSCLLSVAILLAGSAKAQFQFAPATSLIAVNSASDFSPSLSSDGRTLYFTSQDRGGSGSFDIWTATRPAASGLFGTAVNLGSPVNTNSSDASADISLDGLSLVWTSNRPGALGAYDLWMSTRATTNDVFGPAVNLGASVNSTALDWTPNISDGLTLVFQSNRSGGFGDHDLYIATRPNTSVPFGAAVNLGQPINTAAGEFDPSLSADGLNLFFASNRSGGRGGIDLWVSNRASINDPFGTPVNLGPNVNSVFDETGVDIAYDKSSIVFESTRDGGDHMLQAAVVPEPASLVLLVGGAVALFLAFQRRASALGRQ